MSNERIMNEYLKINERIMNGQSKNNEWIFKE